MAIYHMSVKPVSRSAGRSATAAAAYRAGSKIIDQRTGEIHDFTRKQGVLSASLVLPDSAGDWAKDRSTLWNAAEQAERRKDACVAREIVVALPSELDEVSRQELVLEFAKGMADSEGCAVDVCIHEPSAKGDDR
ncbi:MAG: MobA/MobL family protein, partial [Plesiomonas shigelloides]